MRVAGNVAWTEEMEKYIFHQYILVRKSQGREVGRSRNR
jgi:hypothetical protein